MGSPVRGPQQGGHRGLRAEPDRASQRPLARARSTLETARQAIGDAGLAVEQVDGFVASSLFPSAGAHVAEDGVSLVSPNWLAEHLGLNPRYAAGFQGMGQLPGSVSMAVNAVASGAADYVLVHRALHNPSGRYHGNPMTEAWGPQQWTVPQGFFGPLAMIGLAYNEYVQRYGAEREAMAAVVAEARKNGSRIPWSYWYEKPLTADEYLAAPMINDPICRFDCDIPVDGVAAFVFTQRQRAKDLPHPPVYVRAYASGSPTRRRLPLHWPLDDIMEVGAETARRLWEASGVRARGRRPSAGLRRLLALRLLLDGKPRALSGRRSASLCTKGLHRQRSAGRAAGVVRRWRVGERPDARRAPDARVLSAAVAPAGPRQRARASVALACHSSPHLGGAVVYSADA